MPAHVPHKQLKTIRNRLDITQMQAAAMLGVSYPYFLSVETGQRALSRPLARKIERTFGVVKIQDKCAEPMVFDLKRPDSEEIDLGEHEERLVPFTKERFKQYASAEWPYYCIDHLDLVVRPMPRDYALCTWALLEAVAEQRMLQPVIADFHSWFVESVTSEPILESFRRKFDKLFPGESKKSDAFLALTEYWRSRRENEKAKHRKRLDAAAIRAAKKRKKRQKK